MGTINQGLTGGFSGKVGTVVGANWKGINCMRSLASNHHDAKSLGQLGQRAKMDAVIHLLKPLKAFVRIGFKSLAINKSAFNAATSYNMTHAITGIYPDFSVDYSKVMISLGKLTGALNPVIMASVGSQIEFSWENNSSAIDAMANDLAVLVVYNIEKEQVVTLLGGNTRIDKNLTITLPESFAGDEVQCYIAFQNANQRVISDSLFVGNILVM